MGNKQKRAYEDRERSGCCKSCRRLEEAKFTKELLEQCAEAVHKAYCKYYIKNKGEEYWTKGDYFLLDEPTKQIDRETVKAVFEVMEGGNDDNR